MKALKVLIPAALAALILWSNATAAMAGSAAPAWSVQSLAAPTNFKPGDTSGLDVYEVFATNVGGAVTDGSPITITDTLPKGLGVKSVDLFTTTFWAESDDLADDACTESGTEVVTVTCTIEEGMLPPPKKPAEIFPSEGIFLAIHVTVPECPGGAQSCPLLNSAEVQGGGAETAGAERRNEINVNEKASAGFQEYRAELTGPDGRRTSAADSHPYQYTPTFAVNLDPAPPGSILPYVPSQGDIKQVVSVLPPGLVANPTAVLRCSAQQFNTIHTGSIGTATIAENECPDASAIGVATVLQFEGSGKINGQVPIYNLIPPKGMPAQLGFQPALGLPVYIDTGIQTGADGLRIRAGATNIAQTKRVTALQLSIWGTPGDPGHDRMRGNCAIRRVGTCPFGLPVVKPFMRLPSSCQNPLLTTLGLQTWALASTSTAFGEPAPNSCAEPDFSPSIDAKPTTSRADSPSGLRFNLHLPQEKHQDPDGRGEADLRDVSVTLPPGLVVNPPSAEGRAACSPAQIGLKSALGETPIVFDEEPAACPPASKVGKVEVVTPLVDHPVEGSVFLANQEDNPFKSLIALYVALEDPQTGVIIKLAGKVTPNPVTGRISSTFENNPQVPFEDLRFEFFEGARASLRTPAGCGRYTTNTAMTPWTTPEGLNATPSDTFEINGGPDGGCPSGALAPKLSAGMANPGAGTYSSFNLRLTRADGTGEFAGLTTTPPLGFAARLAGIPYCPQSGIDQAKGRERPGQGAREISDASCPSASQVGTVSTGAGAGPSPLYVSGKLYLAGPYKGAPLSLVAVIPAVAGPFDLGVVVSRVASYVDPETAQVKAVADPLPTILSGIPVDVRDLRVNLDRHNFALAPTSCEPKSVEATVLGTSGASASTTDRFQVGGCNALRFKPKLSLKLTGGTKRSAHPALKAVVTYPQGSNYANTAKASVGLPHSEFLEQSHIRTICTRVQFAANACPKGSIYGKARAITPLLDKPLEGLVYLRSSSNPLPDIVLALRGQIDFNAVGRLDSHKGGIRTTFETVPDAPLSKVILEMPGGKKGLLVNSRNICKHVNRATANFTGQNGKTYSIRPVLKDSCKGKKGGKGKKKRGGHGKRG